MYQNDTNTWATTVTSPGDNGRQNLLLALNHYNPITQTTSGLHNVMSNINGDQESMPMLSDQANGAWPLLVSKNSSGTTTVPAQPLWFHQNHIGIPAMHVSHFSQVYRATPNLALTWDTVTMGGQTYVYLPCQGYRWALLVYKG